MFIEEIKIDRYGPVSFRDPVRLSPFTLFFGQNEAGKSLTIDAFVKFLLGKESSGFYKINRVDEYPHGYLIVNVDGKIFKLPEMGTLKTCTKLNLETADFKNVFIIRSSNLDIPDNSNFFLEVTERLTGIKASIIDDLKEQIRNIANLTPRNSFKDVKEIQLKSRLERAEKTIKEIDNLYEELKTRDFDQLVQKYVEEGEYLEKIHREIADLNNAKFRDEYKKALQALTSIKSIKKQLESYRKIREDVKQRWSNLINDKKRIDIEIENDQVKLNDLKSEIEVLKVKLDKISKEFEILNNRMNQITKIKPLIEELEEKESDLEKIKVKKDKVFKPLIYISLIITTLSTLVSIFLHTIYPFTFSIAFLIFSLIGFFNYHVKRGNLRKLIRRLRIMLAKYGIDSGVDRIENIEQSVQRFEEYFEQKKRELDNYRNNLEVTKRLCEELEKKIKENKRKIEDINEKIIQLKDNFGVSGYDEYCKKLDKKNILYNELITNQNYLKKVFPTQEQHSINGLDNSVMMDDDTITWEKRIKELEKYRDLADGVEYDQIRYEELVKEKGEIEEEIDLLSKKLENIKDDVKTVERKINDILRTGPDYVHISTITDLISAKERLTSFIETNQRKRELAVIAIQVFDEIKKKKRGEVSALFSKNSDISDLYREISGGKYQEVVYNSDNSRIIVKDKDGFWLDIDKLSSGAFDQLYFSIRIVLAKKLLGNKNGFFIMDDPFIRSDKERLVKQLKTLGNIVKLGWQVLYFSAKDEVKDLMQDILDDVDFSILEMSSVVL